LLATIAFVLATAPAFRFVGAAYWCLAIAAIVLGLDGLRRDTTIYLLLHRAALTLGILLMAIACVKSMRHASFAATAKMFPPIPTASTTINTTDDGLEVLVPGSLGEAWNARLPSTPHLHPHLAQREAGNLAGGFYIATERSLSQDSSQTSRR
jgi:hypothetical protein